MLPKYPAFKKLEFKDKKPLEEITQKFPPYSDFNFVSLYSYDTEADALVSSLNGNLVIKFRDYITNEPFYSFIGKNKVTETADELLKKAKDEKIMDRIQLIPEVVVKADKNLFRKFKVSEDPDNFDYILDVNSLTSLKGKKFSNKRNLVNRFHKENSNFRVLSLNLSSNQTKEDVLSLFHTWTKVRKKDKEEVGHELKAIKRLLEVSKDLNLIAIGIYIKEKMAGFAVAETLKDDWAIFHFVKGNVNHKGIFEALYMLKGKELLKNDKKLFNIEQDLGLASLRMSKQQWNPVKYLKKYIIQNRK